MFYFKRRNDLSSFNYLAMFIKESMRLYPPVPTIVRELDEPLKIESSLNSPTSCLIPSKTSINVMIFAVHQNQHSWDNPEVGIVLLLYGIMCKIGVYYRKMV